MINLNSDKYWWKSDKGQVHVQVFPYVQKLLDDQAHHEQNNLKNMRLYGNFNAAGMTSQDYNRSSSSSLATANRVTLNIIQSMCDTVQAKIAQQRPKPSFLTEGGEWSLQQKAKKLNKFILGQFMFTKIYDVAPAIFLDACVFGTGVMKVYSERSKIKVERVFPNEIVVDDAESVYGSPRQLHQVKEISKDVLMELFPKQKQQIMDAMHIRSKNYLSAVDYRTLDLITVIESWHLPSTPDSEDGRHTITISTCDLVNESYTRDYFPFVFFKWADRLLGFFGQGIAEQLTGIQIEINKLLRTIQLSMHLTSIPKVFVEKGSGVASNHINNEVGSIIYYTGTKPTFESVGAVPPELQNQLNFLINKAYEITGVSQLSAQSKKPSGLDSGVALREYNEIQSERFAITSQRYESMFLDIAKQMVDLSRDIYSKDKTFAVKAKKKNFIQTIKWEDVDLEADEYDMQLWPTNLLPNTPAGRKQAVIEMLQAGLITNDEAQELLDFPDVQRFSDMKNAPLHYVEESVERMLEEGIYNPPEPQVNLALCVTYTQYAYCKAINDGAPEDRLELLRRFMEDSKLMLEMAAPQAQQDPAALPPVDPGVDPMVAPLPVDPGIDPNLPPM